MACASPSILCATCETLGSEQKPKPGILSCTGCQKYFCSQHITQHRQDLTNLLENTVLNERNALQEKVSTCTEQQWSVNMQVQLERINKWELNTTELIKKSAACARERLQKIALKEGDNLQRQFAILSNEINTLRENENYFENDIKQLINKLQQLQHNIEHFPVELSIKEIEGELIVVKSLVQSASSCAAPCYFVDHLLTSQKPKRSIDLSAKKLGRMHPISDELIAFCYQCQLPTVNIHNSSWESLSGINNANELHWSSSLRKFLALKYSDRNNQPHKLYQFDPYSRHPEEIWEKPPTWKSGWPNNFKTLTSFKQHVLIVVDDRIEKWLANQSDWHTNGQPPICWHPPISCQSHDRIKCIRMNDRYYALMIEKSGYQLFCFELRSHGMSTLHHIETDYNKSPAKMRLIPLPNESGWLFFFCGENKKYCYVLDNDGKRYDQNTVVSSNVADIAVWNNLIFLRKEDEDSNDDVLEIYDWQK